MTKVTKRKTNKKKVDKRINIYLVGLILILLLIIVVIMAIKTNRGMKKNITDNIETRAITYNKYIGKWYQDESDKNVYINITEFDEKKLYFDFKSTVEFKDIKAEVVNNEVNAYLNNGDDKVNANIKFYDDKITFLISDSDSLYFSEGEMYTFNIK